MGDQTIQEFFQTAGWDYLVNKLGNGQHMKQTKAAEAYLARIVKAVKADMQRQSTEG